MGWGGGVAMVSDFFFLFSKGSKSEKKLFSFRGGEGKGGLASVSGVGEGVGGRGVFGWGGGGLSK